MKAADLVVGVEVYYDPSVGWEYSLRGQKVVVVDTALKVKRASTRPGVDPWRSPVAGERGTLVVVDFPQRIGWRVEGKAFSDAVPLAHLRGPYSETWVRVKTAKTKSDQHRAEREQTRNAQMLKVSALVDQAKTRGIDSRRVMESGQIRVSVSPLTFTAMLDALPADWRFPE